MDKLIREGINNQGGVIIENNAKVRLVNISDDDGMVLKQRVSVSVRKERKKKKKKKKKKKNSTDPSTYGFSVHTREKTPS